MIFKVPFNPNHSTILWFCDSITSQLSSLPWHGPLLAIHEQLPYNHLTVSCRNQDGINCYLRPRCSRWRPCKNLTHSLCSIWLEIRKIKPGFRGILKWKLLGVCFFFWKHSQRDFWSATTRSEGHQQLSRGHVVKSSVLTWMQWYSNKQ